jgi:hypothetical protein
LDSALRFFFPVLAFFSSPLSLFLFFWADGRTDGRTDGRAFSGTSLLRFAFSPSYTMQNAKSYHTIEQAVLSQDFTATTYRFQHTPLMG